MPDSNDVWALVMQYGLLGVVLFFLGVALWRGGKWSGENILLPIATAHIAFLRESTTALKQLQGDVALVATCETELRKMVGGHVEAVADPNGLASTVHTNGAIQILSRQLVALAQKHGVDLQDLHDELEVLLRQQNRPPHH